MCGQEDGFQAGPISFLGYTYRATALPNRSMAWRGISCSFSSLLLTSHSTRHSGPEGW
jgi:hypothetical protein